MSDPSPRMKVLTSFSMKKRPLKYLVAHIWIVQRFAGRWRFTRNMYFSTKLPPGLRYRQEFRLKLLLAVKFNEHFCFAFFFRIKSRRFCVVHTHEWDWNVSVVCTGMVTVFVAEIYCCVKLFWTLSWWMDGIHSSLDFLWPWTMAYFLAVYDLTSYEERFPNVT